MDVIDMCKLAKKASRKMAGFSSKAKNDALIMMSEALIKNKVFLLIQYFIYEIILRSDIK
jgi:gamma-glutamyl phosphate reductase